MSLLFHHTFFSFCCFFVHYAVWDIALNSLWMDIDLGLTALWLIPMIDIAVSQGASIFQPNPISISFKGLHSYFAHIATFYRCNELFVTYNKVKGAFSVVFYCCLTTFEVSIQITKYCLVKADSNYSFVTVTTI